MADAGVVDDRAAKAARAKALVSESFYVTLDAHSFNVA